AGVQADLKTVSALGCYGMAAITALTAQNTRGVQAVESISPEFFERQLDSLFSDIRIDAVKIGMLGEAEQIRILVGVLNRYGADRIVLDPLMVASSGDALISSDALDVLKAEFIPLADLITPNIPEAERLLRKAVLDCEQAATDLLSLGAKAVLLKGGHGAGDTCVDILATPDGLHRFESPRIETPNTHGTGCTLSSAIAAYLAKGCDMIDAVARAKVYITGAIENSDALSVGSGSGHGPVHHFWDT
ncbi:MAG: bifunctional hydroxymethylpyrimidine kinase/phosphomethylpyrimidine kinase, partial [Bdellovibrionales bacterium]